MHTLHYIAIKAQPNTPKETILAMVDDRISSIDPDWTDWHVAGGGRYYETPTVISFKDEPEKFTRNVVDAMEQRGAEFEYFAKMAQEAFGNDLSRALDYRDSLEGNGFKIDHYYISLMTNIIMGRWTADSYFYDAENYTTRPDFMEQVDENWYLVPVDFHH